MLMPANSTTMSLTVPIVRLQAIVQIPHATPPVAQYSSVNTRKTG